MCRLCIYMHNTLPKRTYMHHANINRQWIESGSKYFHKENLKARRCMMNKYCHRCGNEISLPSTGLAGNTCRYPSIGLASGFFGLKYPSAVFWGHQPIFNWIFEVCDALRLPQKLRLRRNFRWMFAQSKSSWAQEMNFCAASARKKQIPELALNRNHSRLCDELVHMMRDTTLTTVGYSVAGICTHKPEIRYIMLDFFPYSFISSSWLPTG